MEDLKTIRDKFQRAKLGGIFGILSISFGLMGDVVALILFPGYDFLRRSVSFLCKGPGGLYFQFGTVLSGVFAIFFVLYVIRTFDEESGNSIIKKWALAFAIISCVSFISLGAFCGSDPTTALIHGVSAVISWLSGICYLTLFNIFIFRDPKYSKFLAYIGFCVSISLSLMVLMFFLYYIPGLQNIVIILPLWEWVDTFALIIWYFVVSTYLLIKKI